jgi:hypothetical protein
MITKNWLETWSKKKIGWKPIILVPYRPDITFAVGVVSRYMHEPRSGHLDIVHRILRYLKVTPGNGLWFAKSRHLEVDAIEILIGLVVKMIEDQRRATVYLWEEIWSHGEARNKQLCLGQRQKLNIVFLSQGVSEIL